MNQSIHHQVIVIGAGISGLAAAWQLKQNGIDPLVLEAESFVGGRMRSVQINDALIDTGAQFLSSAYSVIPELIKSVGLGNQFVKTNEQVGLVNNNGISLIHPGKPWQLVTHHLLTFTDFIRLIWQQLKLFNFKKKSLILNDITEWTQYDDQSAINWVVNNFGENVAYHLTAPILNGFYFQSLTQSSASLVAAVTAFSGYQPKTMTLTTGMGSLPQKLSEQLNVKTGVSVSSITETPSNVAIITNAGEFTANYVILTTPAPITKKILRNQDTETSILLDTSYSASATISLLIEKGWNPPKKYSIVYGFLFNPELKGTIAALTLENNKCITRKKEGHLINIMLNNESAKKLLQLTDDEIYTEVKFDVENIFPNIYSKCECKKIFRWPNAMPCTSQGRAKAVQEYRASRNSNNRIWLAGDYLGFPWTDSAAQTGLWAANQVCKCKTTKKANHS